MYKVTVLVLLCLDFAFHLLKAYLTWKQKGKPMPENIRDVYDEEAFARWQAYSAEKSRLSIFSGIAMFAVSVILFAGNVFSAVYEALPGGETVKSLLLLIAYVAAVTLVGLPFSYLNTFRIEEKYGFNRSTRKTFLSDCIKEFILEALLCVGIYLLAAWLYGTMGNSFFVVFFAVVAAFMLTLSMFSMGLQKIFYKFTPLEEGELRTTLAEMFAAEGFRLKDIYVKNASSRTTHANAFCAGLGKFKNISLDDNLVNNYTPREITAVFAHELAHFKHRDTAKMTLCSLGMLLVLTLVVAAMVMVPQISMDFGFSGASLAFAVVLLMSSVLNPVVTVLGIPQSAMSRAFEYRADRFAAEQGYGSELISALKKLHGDSLSNLNPHPLIVALEYSHPTLSQRVAKITQNMGTEK